MRSSIDHRIGSWQRRQLGGATAMKRVRKAPPLGLETRLAYTDVNKQHCWEKRLRAATVLGKSGEKHENHQRAHEWQGL
jgi:hypothetical protein